MLTLTAESWTWYAVTWVVVMIRMASRRLLLGSWRKLQVEDALMLLAMATDTVLIVGMNIISTTSSNLIDPNDPTPLDEANIEERVFGSKMVLVVEQMQCITIWLVKACLLIMYHRLTMSLRQNLAVKIVAAYAAVTFVVMEILYLGVWCRPFTEYWAVPPRTTQCSAATNHLITNAVFNISSDIMIIIIPLPIFLKSTLSPKRKAVLCGVFAVGTFTIVSAVLNKYYSFNQPFGSDWTFWYIRESSTAIIAANLPLTWTLMQRVFNLKSFAEKYYSNQRSRSGGVQTNSQFRSTNYIDRQRHRRRADSLGSLGETDRSASEEHINPIPLKIYQKHEVEISTLPAHDDDGRRMRMASTDSLPDGLKTVTNVRGGGQSMGSRRTEEDGSVKSVGGAVV